jgi:hypothetical protein
MRHPVIRWNKMIIRMDLHCRLGADTSAYSGATADVFAANGRAYKLFRVYGVTRSTAEVRMLFESQCEAYERASADPWLKHHVAEFYGSCVIEDVRDTHGNRVGDIYALDCCYCIEVLKGKEAKLYRKGLRDEFDYLREAQARFTAEGIDVRDSSVFNYDQPEQFKFIDFRLER